MGINVIKCNFSSGELDPILRTRADVSHYHNGAKELMNVIPLVEGGVKKRAGTRFINSGSTSDYVRLIPFAPSSSNPFFIIMGVKKITIVNALTLTVVKTLTTPYASIEEVNSVQYINSRYTLFFAHKNYPVQTLRSSSDYKSWEWSELVFDIPPLDSENKDSRPFKATSSGKDVNTYINVEIKFEDYSPFKEYHFGDLVEYYGKIYQAMKTSTNIVPVQGEYWTVVSNTANKFTSSDIGKIIEINGGLVKITAINSETIITGLVLKALDSVVDAVAGSWYVTSPAFNATDGYATAITYHKQRLVLGGTTILPNKVWFSRIGDPSNFLETTDDADAFSVAPATDRSDNILFLVQTKGGVVVLTGGAEFLISSSGSALTPTTVEIQEQTARGTFEGARPIKVGGEIIFIQRGGKTARALSYRYEEDGLVSPEITSVSAHIGVNQNGYFESTYQQEPDNVIWYVMGTGNLSSVTFDREQQVVAWANHIVSGGVLSVTTTPTALGDDKMFVLVNGSGVIHLCEMTYESYLDHEKSYSVTDNKVDATHLKGFDIANVQAWYENDYGISQVRILSYDGTILTLQDDDYPESIQVGIRIDCKVSMLPVEVAQAPATTIKSKVNTASVNAVIYKTLGLIVNGNDIDDSLFSDNPIEAMQPFSRIVDVTEWGWDTQYNFSTIIEHKRPLPFHLQAVIYNLSVN